MKKRYVLLGAALMLSALPVALNALTNEHTTPPQGYEIMTAEIYVPTPTPTPILLTSEQVIQQIENAVNAALTDGEKNSISGRVYTDAGTYRHNNDQCHIFVARQMAFLDIIDSAPAYVGAPKSMYYNFPRSINYPFTLTETHHGHGVWVAGTTPPRGSEHINRHYQNDALREFLHNLPNQSYNILISFNTGWPFMGSGNFGHTGHVVFIHAKIDGMLYWAESYNVTRRVGGATLPFEPGQVNIATVDEFMQIYGDINRLGGIFGAWAGAARFERTIK